MFIGILVLIAGLNTRSNLLFFLVYIFSSIFIISFIVARLNLKNLEVKRKIDRIAFQNQDMEVSLTLRSKSPVFFVNVVDKFLPGSDAELDQDFYIYEIPDDSGLTVKYRAKPVIRGKFRLGPVRVESHYPFLLFEKSLTLNEYSTVIVYPEITRLKSFPVYEQIMTHSNNKIITSTGGSNEFFGVREYQDGDSIRIIDWKVSARLDELVVKEFEKPLGHSTFIMLDINHKHITGNRTDSNFERGINIAASVAKNRIENNDNLGLILGDDYLLPGTGKEQLYLILERLALVQSSRTKNLLDSFNEAERLVPSGSILVLLCTGWEPEYEYHLKMLRNRNIKVLFVYLVPESFSDRITRENIPRELSEIFNVITLTDSRIYPVFKNDIIAEIFS